MKILNKLAFFSCLFWSSSAFSGTLYSFDNGNLIGFEDGGKISGSYLSEDHADGHLLECKFNFKTTNSSIKKEKNKITAWEKNKYFQAKANGYLYINDDGWRIQINFPSEGCKRFPRSVFSSNKTEAETASISGKKNALGIFVLNKDTNYYSKSVDGFEPIKAKGDNLAKDDLVSAIETQGDFTYIEHYSLTSRAIKSSGWIKSIDLGDSISQ
ncbi:hypothetical protein [Collimonas humicola]|uniref:hypothetical protein n=1 Tax=Collimonas humicola TaxID=2825886 RepID=UPI001B8D0014|nr:hypothetical protein [Collimonas humicola]